MVPKKPKPRNKYAKELGNPLYRQQKIKSVKEYDRNTINLREALIEVEETEETEEESGHEQV
jgi:hypothetical protein